MIKKYGKRDLKQKLSLRFGKKGAITINRAIERYGRAVIVTTGMIKGFIIDTLIPGTFGLPILILKKFGWKLGVIRFEKRFNKIVEFFLGGIIEKEDNKIKW